MWQHKYLSSAQSSVAGPSTRIAGYAMDFDWTTGGDVKVSHVRLIAVGASGEVHLVTDNICNVTDGR
jgi:hypothetical protein